MKILYNLAPRKQPDRVRFFSFTGMMVLLGSILILFGVLHQISYRKKFREKLNQLDLYRSKIRDLSKKAKTYSDEIKGIKGKWNARVQYANKLIRAKDFSYIKVFNVLEEILPDGVLLSNFSMGLSDTDTVSMGIIAQSYSDLNNTYNELMKQFSLSIRSESQSMRSFHAQLEIGRKK